MPHVEIESTRSLAEHAGAQHLIWGWEIAVYLFLGGLSAGLTVAVALRALSSGRGGVTQGMRWGAVLAPVLVSLGMGALFLDLGYKLHVFHFYTTFRPAAPMSWGSWILLLVYPLQLLLVLALPPTWLARKLDAPKAWRLLTWLRGQAEQRLCALARAAAIVGAALGIYTGILLAATVAQPLWSSSVLGPLFLVSGLSTGVALLMLLEVDEVAQRVLAKADVSLLVIELSFLLLWMIALLGQGPLYREAAGLLLWGSYAPVFLGLVVFGGLLVPAALELLGLWGRAKESKVVPVLVLVGGLLLRFVVVGAGQAIGFVNV